MLPAKGPASSSLALIDRSSELQICSDWLRLTTVPRASRALVVEGDSGSGKSTLCQKALRDWAMIHDDGLCLYIDMHDDEFASANIFESLIALAWNDNPELGGRSPNRVPRGASFHTFIVSRGFARSVIQRIYFVMKSVVEFVPGLGTTVDALPDVIGAPLHASELVHIFIDYVSWVAKRRPVSIAIDNYQFVDSHLRLTIESRLGAIPENLNVVLVSRTAKGTARPVIRLPFTLRELRLQYLSKEQTTGLFERLFPELPPARRALLGRDCFLKTQGNLKLIELYAKALKRFDEHGQSAPAASLTEAIAALPELQKTVILLTSIFTAGLRRPYVESALRRVAGASDHTLLADTLEELLALGYLVINGTSNDTVRAAHEQIILAMRESATDAETLRVRKLAIDCFEEQLARDLDPSDYVYLLHCLIGILHFKELLTKLDRVVELIRHQYRAAKYRYLVTLYDSQPDLIRALPTSSVLQLLDAMQKSSSFSKGMTAIQLLRAGGFQDTELLTLFEAKYDIQTYQPAEALRKLQGVGVSGMQLLCKTNALQCLALDQEARSVVDAVIEAQPRSEEDFVVLRNSAHLFSAADARKNLMQSLGFFKDRGHLFGEATVLNNLGVLYLWERSFDDAERVLDKARSIMESLASDEIFQSQINLGVLETLRGNYTNADNWLRLARSYVPRELQLDKVLVDLDTTLLGVVAGRVTPAEAVHSMRVLHREAGMLNDPRLRNSIAFNMRELALLTDSAPGVEVEPRFDELFQSRNLSGFEVIEDFVVETAKGRCLFVLSPHWRH